MNYFVLLFWEGIWFYVIYIRMWLEMSSLGPKWSRCLVFFPMQPNIRLGYCVVSSQFVKQRDFDITSPWMQYHESWWGMTFLHGQSIALPTHQIFCSIYTRLRVAERVSKRVVERQLFSERENNFSLLILYLWKRVAWSLLGFGYSESLIITPSVFSTFVSKRMDVG